MSVHVGIQPSLGNVAVYYEKTKETIEFKIMEIVTNDSKDENIYKMFKEITVTINEKLGFACICLEEYYGSEIRKNTVKIGKLFGFLKIQIINFDVAFYLNQISKINKKPKNGDIIWIIKFNCIGFCCIFEKINSKAKTIKKVFLNQEKDLKKILEELISKNKISGNQINPDIFIYFEGSTINSDDLKILFTKYECFEVNGDRSSENACLMKARIMANDSEVMEYDVEMQTYSEIYVEINETIVLSVDKLQLLPFEKILSLTAKEENNIFKIYCGFRRIEEIKLVPLNRNSPLDQIIIKIDLNGIITIDYFESNNEGATLTENPNSFLKLYKIPSKMKQDGNINAIGIDLGTSRCFAAVNRRNGIEIIPLDNTGERHLPSYVSFKEEKELCGQIVVNKLKQNSKFTVFDAKSIIGKRFNEIEIDETWPFEVTGDKENIILKVFDSDGIIFKRPAQIFAVLLKHIKKKCEEIQGKMLDKVLITVPASFSENQKSATIEAGRLAGWDFVNLLPEPIAASLAYFVDRPIPNEFTFMLFDFGGGTLDVCVVKVINESLEILNIGGYANLGGRDFDNLLFGHFSSILLERFNIDVKAKDRLKYLLLQKCMEIKHTLSLQKEDTLDISDFNTQLDDNIIITTQEFETLSSQLLGKVQQVIIKTLSTTNFTSKDIHKVLLVGGSSRMPMIRELLRKMFTKAEHCCEENPDEVVAIGAAHYAYHLASTL